MPFLFLVDDGDNRIGDFSIGGPTTEHKLQIVIFLAEKAGAKFAVGSEADTRTVSAERLRDRSDKANFSAAVGKPVFTRGLAALVNHRDERPAGGNAPE